MKEAAATTSIFDIAKTNKKSVTPMASAAAMLAVRSPTVPANTATASVAAAVAQPSTPAQQATGASLEGYYLQIDYLPTYLLLLWMFFVVVAFLCMCLWLVHLQPSNKIQEMIAILLLTFFLFCFEWNVRHVVRGNLRNRRFLGFLKVLNFFDSSVRIFIMLIIQFILSVSRGRANINPIHKQFVSKEQINLFLLFAPFSFYN